jgi:hypothetical protein
MLRVVFLEVSMHRSHHTSPLSKTTLQELGPFSCNCASSRKDRAAQRKQMVGGKGVIMNLLRSSVGATAD